MGSGKGRNKRVALLMGGTNKKEVKEIINILSQKEIVYKTSLFDTGNDWQKRLIHAEKVFNNLIKTFNSFDDLCISSDKAISKTLDVLEYSPNYMDGTYGLCATKHGFKVIIVNTPLIKNNITDLMQESDKRKPSAKKAMPDENGWTDIKEILNELKSNAEAYDCLVLETRTMVLLHELGHYLMDTRSDNGVPKSKRLSNDNLEELRVAIFTQKIIEELGLDNDFTDTFGGAYTQEMFNRLLQENDNNLKKTTKQMEKVLPDAHKAVKRMKTIIN